ncbi:MarR family transcriptional regulator [Streptomyces sp. B-S-A8]|uniref:MarR family transcriptional regulator n=1 Tax=Streptomyces solicavernae TaxID=3043614 RepID=A0ABT6RW89_9ACTN|nr:MarR family transcriptional regulator [Streptomyces sp. B-S-A8]MDI3388713.1 MarR family transcriptional regulator [Streptomyces sp. B-S-A8]
MEKQENGRIGIVAALVRSSFLVNAVYAESGREYGVTPQQGQLLCVLMGRPYGMGELGATLRLAKSSLTGLVDRTERNGLVRREPDPRDTRAVRVALTRQGADLAKEFYDATCRRIDELPTSLTPDERETLTVLLARVVQDNEVPVVFGSPGEPGPGLGPGPGSGPGPGLGPGRPGPGSSKA